jgi:predicted ATPase
VTHTSASAPSTPPSNGATTFLDDAGRELFARLSVFAGSFPLDAAEDVCDADLDCLASLVDYSLIKPVGDDRFLMLETIREYAREKLVESGRGG